MERTARFSDKGKKVQASSKPKAPDVVRRVAKHGEQSHRVKKSQADQKSISGKEHTSNPKESTIKPQKDRTSGLRESNFEARWSSQKHRNAGQERRKLRGGGDGEESSKSQSQNQELTRKLAEQEAWREAADRQWRQLEVELSKNQRWRERGIDTIESVTGPDFVYKLGQTDTGRYGQGRKNDSEAGD